jgi:DNA uptake protein ComE-like DNA-binding protein
MKILSVLGALGVGIFAAAWLAGLQRRGSAVQTGTGLLNINQASQQEMMRVLGLDADTAERIVEHRPYPSKMDLLGRMIVPEEIYRSIKDRIVYKAG